MRKFKLTKQRSSNNSLDVTTVIDGFALKLNDELSYATLGLGMKKSEFKKKEVIPFMTLYIFVYSLLMIMVWGPFSFLWQLVIISLTSIFAYYGFSHLLTVRKEREIRWRREQGYSDSYDPQHLLQKRGQAIIQLLKQMNCFTEHFLGSLTRTLDNDLVQGIVKDYPSHIRGGFFVLLSAIIQEVFQSPLSINSLFTPKIFKMVLSYIAVVAIMKFSFFIKKYFSPSYRRKKDLHDVLRSIQDKLSKKKSRGGR